MDPRRIPDDLIDRAACAMCGFNDIMQHSGRMWADVKDPERGHWLALAKAALIAISPHVNAIEQGENNG
jgi:hypothetical protein